jgi:tRNA1(Val) A37 N6-methylase TrmN6
VMNPPFHDAARTNPSRDPARRTAHVGGRGLLAAWVKSAARLLRDGGELRLIYAAEGLDDMLAALAGGFGAVAVMPVYPKPGASAIRIVVGAVKASHQPMRLLPGLTLNNVDGPPTRQAEDILRQLVAIDLGG